MYAVVETGGKQYRVSVNDVLFVEKLPVEEGKTVELEVMALSLDSGELKVGDPFVKGAKVVAEVTKNGKSKKITVFTYKPKKGSKRKMGHRQPYTKLLIKDIKA